MKTIHAWILAPTKRDEDHHYFRCKSAFGFWLKLLYCKIFFDYIEVKQHVDYTEN